MMKFKKYILTISIIGLALNAFSQIEFREIKTEGDWVKAVEAAGSSDKLLFLDIYATWCGPCKYLENNVYTDEELGEYYNKNFVNLKMDGESEFGAIMARKYRLSAYPTMYYLNANEEIITTIVGVREAGPLKGLGETITESSERLGYLETNFTEDNLDASELMEYRSILVSIEQDEKAAQVSGKILPGLTDEQILSNDFKAFVINAPADIDSRSYKIVSENSDIVSQVWTASEQEKFYEGVFNNSLINAINNKDEVLLQRIINEVLPVYMGAESENLSQGEFITRKLYYANTNDWERYDSLVNKEFIADGSKDTFLYMQAYEVANEYNKSPEALNMAIEWMLQAEQLNPSFDNLVLTSYLYAIAGDFKNAISFIDKMKAMELSEDQKKVLNELENNINQAMTG